MVIFPEGKTWDTVYEYAHNYTAARYGRNPDAEDAASDAFLFVFDKWAKAPSTKLGEWDPDMAFAFAIRMVCLKARKSLGDIIVSNGKTVSLEQVLSEDGFDEDYTLTLALPEYADSTLTAAAENEVAANIIQWCLDNPDQRRWMEEFLSGMTLEDIGKTAGQTKQAAWHRRAAGIAHVKVAWAEELEGIR